MKKLIITSVILLLAIGVSCKHPKDEGVEKNSAVISKVNEQDKNDKKTDEEEKIKSKKGNNGEAAAFLRNLETGEKLSSFFSENWLFVFHEDNRCDGTTDGQIDNLKKNSIDNKIKLQVNNNGDGWACDKKEPKTYIIDFELKNKVLNWDRFEIFNFDENENSYFIAGSGESDYLKIYFGDNDLIIKLEYRSEDPG